MHHCCYFNGQLTSSRCIDTILIQHYKRVTRMTSCPFSERTSICFGPLPNFAADNCRIVVAIGQLSRCAESREFNSCYNTAFMVAGVFLRQMFVASWCSIMRSKRSENVLSSDNLWTYLWSVITKPVYTTGLKLCFGFQIAEKDS